MSRTQALHGVFLGSHAIAEGFVTRKQLQANLYRRLMHNVYADPALPADHGLYARGAALLMPPGAVLGGRSAAAWHGAPFASAGDPVVVLVPPETAWRGCRGIRIHRSALAAQDVMQLDDVRITGALRTAWDVATLESVPTAVSLLDGMARAGRLDTAAFVRLAESSRGRWRRSRVAIAASLVDGRSASPPESWVRVACVRAGLPAPVPQYVVLEGGAFLGRVDLAWPEARLIVEYEGPHHFEGLQTSRDDRRYEGLVAAGWQVIRLGAADLRDLPAVVARIEDALTSGAHA